MRFSPLFYLVTLLVLSSGSRAGYGESPSGVSLATHEQRSDLSSSSQTQATERIRKIVLNQGDDARALANLVQLTRKLPASATSQLYLDLTDDYLRGGKYNQAANVLQQHLTQYPDQPSAVEALVTLVRLYSSSEVTHSQQTSAASAGKRQGFIKYANYLAERTVQKNAALANHPALTFQRAVATRLNGRGKAAQGRLTQLKHKTGAGTWQARARAEQWLPSDRQEESPIPVVVCRQTDERPHLDGKLNDPLWNKTDPVQFAYDEGFLYLVVSTPKADGQSYEADARPRSYDADLRGHDHVRLRLDLDRDYATCYELAVDHRGWTNDRCWFDTGWNLQWFVAAGGNDSTWTVEAAIPWDSLAYAHPQPGDAWTVSWDRVLPGSKPRRPGAEAPSTIGAFQLLLFE